MIQVPSRWRDDAREGTGAHLGWFRGPMWGQALAGTCASGGRPIGYGVGKVEPYATGANALRRGA